MSSSANVRAHRVVRGLDAAESGSFLHHEAEQTREDGGDGPRRVPCVWVEVGDGQTQPAERHSALQHGNVTPLCATKSREEGKKKRKRQRIRLPRITFKSAVGGYHVDTWWFKWEFPRKHELSVIVTP